jgi:DNA-binding LytR/AlgR family response regulator
MEEKLPEHQFIRIHKSFIIALDKITSYSTEQVRLGEQALPLGRLFKSGFFKKVQAKNA